jgi:putative glutamine amidotransferase
MLAVKTRIFITSDGFRIARFKQWCRRTTGKLVLLALCGSMLFVRDGLTRFHCDVGALMAPADGMSGKKKEWMMQGKPIIGVNVDFRSARKDAPAYAFLAAGYFDAIQRVGGIPILLPPTDDDADLAAMLDLVHGVLLVSGHDLDPRRDGFMLHSSVRMLDARREGFDRRLARRIVAQKKPVFGVGVGMQLLNVEAGGNLFLHLPEDCPDALPHRDSQDPSHRHSLDVAPMSLMERVYGDGEIRVNSFHHMAVDEVGEGLRITARCPDGVVEAIESDSDDWIAIGTQFHPEADTASALDIRIFEEFILGITSRVAELRMVA